MTHAEVSSIGPRACSSTQNWRAVLAALVLIALSACGGGSASSSSNAQDTAGTDEPDSGSTNPPVPPELGGAFTVTYTHTADIASWEWAVDWFVEANGALSGPFDSAGSGVVDLGSPGTATAHVSRREGPFVVSYMDVPVSPIRYFTGTAEIGPGIIDVTVNLDNATVGEELLLFYPFVNWWEIDSNPYSLTQSVAGADLVDDTGRASVFISYRQSGAEEPGSRYDFRTDLDPNALSDVGFDVLAMRQRTQNIEWQSSEILTGNDRPALWAKRNGVYLLVGDSTDGINTSGSIGLPDQFPADEWYLFTGLSARPDMVKRVDPAAAETVPLEPMSGFIDDSSVAYDAAARTLSFLAPGMTPIDFGHVQFGSTTDPWALFFPGSALTIVGDMVVLDLPQNPDHPTLPDFQSVTIELFRLDDGATPVEMYRYLWNRRAESLPSYAMASEFEPL